MKIVNNDVDAPATRVAGVGDADWKPARPIEEPKPVSKLETGLVVGMAALLVAAALWLVWIGG